MNTTTLDKMRRMRLFAMYHTFKSTMESPHNDPFKADEMTTLLVDSKWDDRTANSCVTS